MGNFDEKNKKYEYKFLDFIDSPDIRSFSMNTSFTPTEQVVLIAKSRKRTVEEKINALQYLVDHYSEDEFQVDSTNIRDYYEKTEGKFQNCIIKIIEKWKEILQDRYRKFDWTDDTDILELESCSEEELPER